VKRGTVAVTGRSAQASSYYFIVDVPVLTNLEFAQASWDCAMMLGDTLALLH
jgi:hypothetical protein